MRLLKRIFLFLGYLFCIVSCRTLADADVMGCYQSPSISDLSLYDYDIIVLHENHKYSKFTSDKDYCDRYKTFLWPYKGTWSLKGNTVSVMSYVQSNTKGWVIESRDPKIGSDSLRILVHSFIDGSIDTVINYFHIKSKRNPQPKGSLPDKYAVLEGTSFIRRKTDKLNIVRDSTFIISNFEYEEIEFTLRDSLSNILDIYAVPKRLHDVNINFKYKSDKLKRYSDRYPWKVLYLYQKIGNAGNASDLLIEK